MIVDTSFILDVIDDVDPAVQKERELETENVPLVIPSMTVLERKLGVGGDGCPEEWPVAADRLLIRISTHCTPRSGMSTDGASWTSHLEQRHAPYEV